MKEEQNNFTNNKHTRSKRDYERKKNDIVEVELSKLRNNVEKAKAESKSHHQSLKEALAKAIVIEDGKVKSLKANKEELEKEVIKDEEEIKQDNLKMEEIRKNDLREKLQEVPEKVLRDLVEE